MTLNIRLLSKYSLLLPEKVAEYLVFSKMEENYIFHTFAFVVVVYTLNFLHLCIFYVMCFILFSYTKDFV